MAEAGPGEHEAHHKMRPFRNPFQPQTIPFSEAVLGGKENFIDPFGMNGQFSP